MVLQSGDYTAVTISLVKNSKKCLMEIVKRKMTEMLTTKHES